MDTAALVSAATTAAEYFEEPIKKISTAVYNKCEKGFKKFLAAQKLGKDDWIRAYIVNSYDKVGRTKTLLHKHSPQRIEDFCISTDLYYKEGQQRHVIETDKITNIFSHSRKTIITGLGGMGKTILMKYMFINCINQTEYIPVFIELRNIKPEDDGTINVFNCIKNALSCYGLALDDELLKLSLEKGSYLILFDGFDEVKSELSDSVAQSIVEFSNSYELNYYILSSRPSDRFISWSNFKELKTKELTKQQALRLLDKLTVDETIKKHFKIELESKLFEKHESFASNPLLLTIMLIVYIANGFLPEDFCEFYEEAFGVLYYKHDHDSKFAYHREMYSSLSVNDFKRLFSYFCFKSFFKERFSFSETELMEQLEESAKKMDMNVSAYDLKKDLCRNLCMLVKEGLSYKFVHRSFQEYFAALYTTKLRDDDQKKIIKHFLMKSQAYSSEYFLILKRLDSERLYKNIISDMLDELQTIYTSVEQNDYDFLIELLKDLVCSKNDTHEYLGVEHHEDLFYSLAFLMSFYNISEDDSDWSLSRHRITHYDELIHNLFLLDMNYIELTNVIFAENAVECDSPMGKMKEMKGDELIYELCNRLGSNEAIMKKFQPLIDTLKSWFTNRLYQDSSIDDLLEDI